MVLTVILLGKGSSYRATVLAPSWSVLYVQSSKGVTQFSDLSLVKQWEGYSLLTNLCRNWPRLLETRLMFQACAMAWVCNVVLVQKNMLRMQVSQTPPRLVSLPLLEVLREICFGHFSFPEDSRLRRPQAPPATLLRQSVIWVVLLGLPSPPSNCSPPTDLRKQCPLHCFLRTLNEQARLCDQCFIRGEYM